MRNTITSVIGRRRPGTSLFELSFIIGATTLAAGILAATMIGALRIEKASANALRQMAVRNTLADQFRTDVAVATETPARWQEEMAGPVCLILRIDDQRHVVYRWQEDQLTRSSFTGKEEHRYTVALGNPGVAGPAVEFARTGRLVSLRLFTLLPTGDKRMTNEFSAALGGDRQ
jgi:hypothetical protein